MDAPYATKVRADNGFDYLIEARPAGAQTEIIPDSGPLPWISPAPGDLGILGRILHHTVYLSRWDLVVVVASGPAAGAECARRRYRNRRAAVAAMPAIADRVSRIKGGADESGGPDAGA